MVEKMQGLESEDLIVNPNSFAYYPGEVDKLFLIPLALSFPHSQNGDNK